MKALFRVLFSLILLGSLKAVENRIFVGIGVIPPGNLFSTYHQEVYKDVASCTSQGVEMVGVRCYGGMSDASYRGRQATGLEVLLGDEASFDPYRISGLRFYVSASLAKADLGSRMSYTQTQSNATFKGENNSSDIALQNPAIPQIQLATGLHSTFSINLDFFANLPLYLWLEKLSPKIPEIKLGIYAGFGAEFSFLKSENWVNESLDPSQRNGAFFASGRGLFLNLGGSFYVAGKHRIDIGVKIPYYTLNQSIWSIAPLDRMDVWTQQTLHQSFSIQPKPLIRVVYAFLF